MKKTNMLIATIITMIIACIIVSLLSGEEALRNFLVGTSAMCTMVSAICLIMICLHGEKERQENEKQKPQE